MVYIRFCLCDMTYPSEPVLRQKQTSVIRTNCMDCLDRTNVVQSTIGRWVLNKQLREVKIFQSTEVIENDEQFMTIFKNGKLRMFVLYTILKPV